ncbi:unnamed protein product [Sphagnum compactum]
MQVWLEMASLFVIDAWHNQRQKFMGRFVLQRQIVSLYEAVSTSSSSQVEGSDSGMEQTNEYEARAHLFPKSSPEGGNLLAPRVSTSFSIQAEGSDSGMEQTNEYEGLTRLFRESSPEGGNLLAPRVSTSSSIHVDWQRNLTPDQRNLTPDQRNRNEQRSERLRNDHNKRKPNARNR